MSFDAERNSDSIVARLRELADPERARQQKRYLKSDLDFLGVTVPDLRKTVLITAREQGVIGHDELVDWVRALWDDVLFERRLAAVELLRARAGLLTDHDLPLLEELIRRAAGWALVDPLSGDIAGRVALTQPRAWRAIDRWAGDQDFWLRRSAMLALLAGIGTGQPDTERFERYAAAMMGEREFFVRKAIGWVLRELSKRDPGYVIAFTTRHVSEMSGVTFREAIRRLPPHEAAFLSKARSK